MKEIESPTPELPRDRHLIFFLAYAPISSSNFLLYDMLLNVHCCWRYPGWQASAKLWANTWQKRMFMKADPVPTCMGFIPAQLARRRVKFMRR